MLTAYDAVTAANLPADAAYAFYYADGEFSNGQAVRERCPHATLEGITVLGSGGVRVCDCETGDLTPAQAVAWVAHSLEDGMYRPCVYANLDRWENQGLGAELERYGSKIRRWVAHYDDVAEIPAGYDAKQYKTGDVDVNVCADNFFDLRAPAPKPDPKPAHGTARTELEIDLRTHDVTNHPIHTGTAHWGDADEWVKAEVELCIGGPHAGAWRLVKA